MSDAPKPLTGDEERALREWRVGEVFAPSVTIRGTEELIARLFATLDASRALAGKRKRALIAFLATRISLHESMKGSELIKIIYVDALAAVKASEETYDK